MHTNFRAVFHDKILTGPASLPEGFLKGVHVSLILADVFGFLGAGCTTVSFVPQVLKVWRSRSARDISAGMYLLFIAGLAFWLAYGLMIGSWPILIANTLTIALAAMVLWMKWYFERSSN